MTNAEIVEQRLVDQAFKERMILDSIIILATVEYIQDKVEQKLLEIDALGDDYTFEDTAKIRIQVLMLLAKLKQEEKRMDEFMAKYRRLINEKKGILPAARKKKQIYLRGVPSNTRR